MSTHPHHKLARSAGIFTGATLVSRLLGYVRDTLVANRFGAGAAADAFYAAFGVANLLRRILGEGALSASFIPVFSEYGEKHGKERAQDFLNVMFTLLCLSLIALILAGVFLAEPLTRLIAMGFERTPERFALTVILTRYMLPFLLFICLAALLTGVLNALHSFFLPALAPACLSVAEIGYLLVILPFLSPQNRVIGLAISVVVGGFLQFLVHLPALWKKGFHLRMRWNFKHAGARRVGKLMIPAGFGMSVDQVNTYFDRFCASFLTEGSVTVLHYSSRVMQLPLALFGIALSQVALPSMAVSVARGRTDEVKDTVNFAIRLTLFMILPAMTGLIVLGQPIVKILFEHGRFTPDATVMTASALAFFSAGLLAYAAVKILAGAFYAFQNTHVPMMIAIGCVLLNVLLDILFIRYTALGVGGLALATTTASWANAISLFVLLRRKLGPLDGLRIGRTFLKSAAGCAGMTAFCLALMRWGAAAPLPVRLGVAIAGGFTVYMGIVWLLQMEEWKPFWSQLSRPRAVPPIDE